MYSRIVDTLNEKHIKVRTTCTAYYYFNVNVDVIENYAVNNGGQKNLQKQVDELLESLLLPFLRTTLIHVGNINSGIFFNECISINVARNV